jgi:hypothetical protein
MPRITHTQVKAGRGEPMIEVRFLEVSPLMAANGAAQSGWSPRQLTVACQESLDECRITAAGSRANILIGGGREVLRSGARVAAGSVVLRVTMPCEPCGYGARLAGVPLARFRRIERYLAVAVAGGACSPGQFATIRPGVWPSAPESFRERAHWAAGRIPVGLVTPSTEFLTAIGASSAYLRALPRWLRHAASRGAPVHRVLTARLTVPSWAPDATRLLMLEGLCPADYRAARHNLSRALWFDTNHPSQEAGGMYREPVLGGSGGGPMRVLQ